MTVPGSTSPALAGQEYFHLLTRGIVAIPSPEPQPRASSRPPSCSSPRYSLFDWSGNRGRSMLSQKARYAIRALLVLGAKKDGETALIADVARGANVPRKFLE